MMDISMYTPQDLDEIEEREDDDWGVDRQTMEHMASISPAWTVRIDGEIAIIMGVWQLWKGNWECWAVPSDVARGHAVPVVKAARAIIEEVFDMPTVNRLTALSREDKPEYNKWLALLGFKEEYRQRKAYDGKVDVIGFMRGMS